MRNIIWAKDGKVRITILTDEYEGSSQDLAAELLQPRKNMFGDEVQSDLIGWEAVLFDVDTFGLGASELKFKNGVLRQAS